MTTHIEYDLSASNAAPGAAPQTVVLTAVVNPDGSPIGSAGAGTGGVASSGATSFAAEFVSSLAPVDIRPPSGTATVLKSVRAVAYDPQATQAGVGVLHLMINNVVYSMPYAAASTPTQNVFELLNLTNLNMPIPDGLIQAQLGSPLTGGGIVVAASFA